MRTWPHLTRVHFGVAVWRVKARAWIGMLLLSLSASRGAHAMNPQVLVPSTLFAQAGSGDQSTRAYVAGATRNWHWRLPLGAVHLSGFFEAAGGRWIVRAQSMPSSTRATQRDVTPVLRFSPSGAVRDWFGELGVDANYIVPVYRAGKKRFSTEFNFGDQLAVGY